MHAIS